MKKVLIVDDQNSWVNFHTDAVKRIYDNNVIIVQANSANDAYSEVLKSEKLPFDYILTDMQMEENYYPKMAGEWLIEQVQTLTTYYKTKIIIISASAKIKQIAERYNVFYIPKSVAANVLDSYKQVLM